MGVRVLALQSPIIAPHGEYVALMTNVEYPNGSGEIMLTTTPVWISQVIIISGFPPKNVNKRVSEEKVRPLIPHGVSRGKMLSRPRVTASTISMVLTRKGAPQAIAMNSLHGDHRVWTILEGNLTDTTLWSHEVGSPQTILAKGWACSPYSLHTIDVLGDNGRAEL